MKYSQYLYFIGFLLTTITSWLLRDYGDGALDFSPLNACIIDPNDTSCLGQQAVRRICFGTFLFFCLHFVLLLGVTSTTNRRLAIHTGFWPIKFLLWGGLIGSTFAMSNTVLDGFAQAARVFSTFFIVLQLIILLEFFYWINEWLLERESRACAVVLAGGSFLMIAGSFVGIGFMYNYYAPSSSCSLNIWFITSTILFFLLYAAISVSPIRNKSAGLFTSAAVFAYCSYYCWSALNSEPAGGSCTASSVGANKVVQILGFVIAILALGISTMNSGVSSQAFDLDKGSGTDKDLQYRPDFFHAMYFLASCYMLLLLVGWDLSGSGGDFNIDQGWGSTWVKMAASWLCALLYCWSLIAHRVLRDREF